MACVRAHGRARLAHARARVYDQDALRVVVVAAAVVIRNGRHTTSVCCVPRDDVVVDDAVMDAVVCAFDRATDLAACGRCGLLLASLSVVGGGAPVPLVAVVDRTAKRAEVDHGACWSAYARRPPREAGDHRIAVADLVVVAVGDHERCAGCASVSPLWHDSAPVLVLSRGTARRDSDAAWRVSLYHAACAPRQPPALEYWDGATTDSYGAKLVRDCVGGDATELRAVVAPEFALVSGSVASLANVLRANAHARELANQSIVEFEGHLPFPTSAIVKEVWLDAGCTRVRVSVPQPAPLEAWEAYIREKAAPRSGRRETPCHPNADGARRAFSAVYAVRSVVHAVDVYADGTLALGAQPARAVHRPWIPWTERAV